VGGLTARSAWPEDAAIAARREVLRLVEGSGREPGGSAVTPQAVLGTLRPMLRHDATVACDGGPHRHFASQAWPVYWPRTFLTPGGLSGTGFALPAAIAAKLALPDREVACFVDDGGLLACLGELETIARLGLRVLILVWVDERSPSMRLQRGDVGLPDGADVGPSDFEAVARGLGLLAQTIHSADDVGRALCDAASHHGPALVQAPIAHDAFKGTSLW
jgi:thiamine pyrophosphate-dependent acetolactate synthase large subunit-like protein